MIDAKGWLKHECSRNLRSEIDSTIWAAWGKSARHLDLRTDFQQGYHRWSTDVFLKLKFFPPCFRLWTSGELPRWNVAFAENKQLEPSNRAGWLFEVIAIVMRWWPHKKSTGRTRTRNFRLIAGWLLHGPEWNNGMKRTQSWAEMNGLHYPLLQKIQGWHGPKQASFPWP